MSTGFYWPIGTENYSSGYGFWLSRSYPNGDYTSGYYHIGVDMITSLNEYFYPVSNGQIYYISRSEDSWGTGNVCTVVKHWTEDGIAFLVFYGHGKLLKNYQGSEYSEGDWVWAGVPFMEAGSWIPPHLHFGIRTEISLPNYFGRIPNTFWPAQNNFVDPIEFLQTHQAPWGSDVTSWQECVLEGSNLCSDIPETKVLGWMMENPNISQENKDIIEPLFDPEEFGTSTGSDGNIKALSPNHNF